MADILIRGMEMPKENEILVFDVWHGKMYARSTANTGARRYEVVSLQEGHGKIIDGDALWENMTVEQSEAFQKGLAGTIDLFEMLETAIPIVPAEGGTDNG